MADDSSAVSRRKSMQLMLGVTALGLALGKRAGYAEEVSTKNKDFRLSSAEKAIYIKLTKTEQSLFIKLTSSERSQYIKLTGAAERSQFLKHNAD